MKTLIQISKIAFLNIALLASCVIVNAQSTGTIPELVFTKAVLISGVSNKDGAVYKFSNVAAGVDATMTIVGRSGSSVVLDTIDLGPAGGNGFDKALQPQLGIHGNVPANSSWWMKFQLSFFQAGTSKALSIDKFTVTALDIDGDGSSVAENVQMDKATAVSFAPTTVLTKPAKVSLSCPKCNKLGLPIPCLDCIGLGYTVKNGQTKACGTCDGTGLVFATCNHAWAGSNLYVPGPTANANGIDTSAVENMATFTYNNTSSITITYGATTGSKSSTAGQRLNSMWFKSFNLTPFKLLPITLLDFTAAAANTTAQLVWSSSEQINFSHFIVERSIDGINFADAAMVFGSENKAGVQNYSYADKNISSATSSLYYRLKMVDADGQSTYSKVLMIKLNNNINAPVINAYPNPVTATAFISIPAIWQNKAIVINIYSTSGICVKTMKLANAMVTQSIDLSQVTKGTYIVNISSNGQNAQAKIIKG